MKKLDIKKLDKNINEIAKFDLENKKVFGSAYYVFQEDNIDKLYCFGNTGAKTDKKVNENTIFRIASMSKPVTAFAALILIDRGMLSLDDTVDKFLPEFKDIHVIDGTNDLGRAKNNPTVRNILTHSSGLGGNPFKPPRITKEDKETLDSAISFCLRVGLGFEPGTTQAYSGFLAFDVLTRIVEIVSGRDFYEFIKNEIFEPCGMKDTAFMLNAEQESRLISMHNRVDGENVDQPMYEGCIFDDLPSTRYTGGAGLASSIKDYSAFARMFLNKGVANGKRLVREETFSLLSSPQISKEIMACVGRWGLGVRVIAEPEYPFLPVNTFGWSGAYGSHFWVDPQNKIFVVFMKNSYVDGGAGNQSAESFEKAVYTSFE